MLQQISQGEAFSGSFRVAKFKIWLSKCLFILLTVREKRKDRKMRYNWQKITCTHWLSCLASEWCIWTLCWSPENWRAEPAQPPSLRLPTFWRSCYIYMYIYAVQKERIKSSFEVTFKFPLKRKQSHTGSQN